MTDISHSSLRAPRMVWGAVLFLLGAVLLLDNLDVLSLGHAWSHWPLILAAIGVGHFLSADRRRERGSGLWWIFIGLWLEVSVHRFWGLGFRESWPILLIAFGVSMVWNSIVRREPRNCLQARVTFGVGDQKGEST
ncbi:MAG: hypothetical protein HBSIN02_14480 [Bacteroidia bacterium]|nr:MAG: hypothetical protein HBSIN02_14480 [Bacteroidia bacterium]